MRLIVGLGNPGPEYQWTPHNLGFLAVDEIANRASIRVERPEGKALVGLGKVAGQEVILAKHPTREFVRVEQVAAVRKGAHLETLTLHHVAEGIPHSLVVINDENDGLGNVRRRLSYH